MRRPKTHQRRRRRPSGRASNLVSSSELRQSVTGGGCSPGRGGYYPSMTTPATLTRERTAAPAGAGPRSPRTRIDSVDVVRGLVMILMALDHTRDFFGSRADPTNVA